MRPDTCPRCRRTVLAGYADAVLTRLDPAPLTPAQEIDALARRQPTYDLYPDRVAVRRTASRITHDHGQPVHAEHDCHHPSPDPSPRHRTSPSTPDHPPF